MGQIKSIFGGLSCSGISLFAHTDFATLMSAVVAMKKIKMKKTPVLLWHIHILKSRCPVKSDWVRYKEEDRGEGIFIINWTPLPIPQTSLFPFLKIYRGGILKERSRRRRMDGWATCAFLHSLFRTKHCMHRLEKSVFCDKWNVCFAS